MIFMSPEATLTDMRWRDMLSSPIFQERLVALIVDEAHCVKKWYIVSYSVDGFIINIL